MTLETIIEKKSKAKNSNTYYFDHAVVKLGGGLVAVTKRQKNELEETFDLYQPQTLQARILKFLCLKVPFALKMREVSCLKGFLIEEFNNSLLETLGWSSISSIGGLIGNGDGNDRKYIFQVSNSETKVILKLGLTKNTKLNIENEYEMMDTISKQSPEIFPALFGLVRKPNYSFHLSEYLPSKRINFHNVPIYAILNMLVTKESIMLSKSLENTDFDSSGNDLDDIRINRVIEHGDLAPWNMRYTTSGGYKLIDLESSKPTGMPLADWVHWYVQYYKLVKNYKAEKIATELRKQQRDSDFSEYLKAIGLDQCQATKLILLIIDNREKKGTDPKDFLSRYKNVFNER